MNQKTIITCAVTGSAPKTEKAKATPVTPEEIANSSLDAEKAGAAVCHIHVRDPETGQASMEFKYYKEVTERIRDAGSNMIINLTTGPGARYMPSDEDPTIPGPGTEYVTPAKRTFHVEQLKPEVCSLDVATMNFGERAFMNVPRHMRMMADSIKAAGVKPELEVFDGGHIELCKQLIKEGHIAEPPYFQLCLGISYGATATPEAMMYMRDRLPAGAPWSAFGISRTQFPMVAMAVALGGNVRVGLEDNLYLGAGEMAPSNAALVERAATIIENMGSSVATPDEARKILGLGNH